MFCPYPHFCRPGGKKSRRCQVCVGRKLPILNSTKCICNAATAGHVHKKTVRIFSLFICVVTRKQNTSFYEAKSKTSNQMRVSRKTQQRNINRGNITAATDRPTRLPTNRPPAGRPRISTFALCRSSLPAPSLFFVPVAWPTGRTPRRPAERTDGQTDCMPGQCRNCCERERGRDFVR